MEERAYIDWLLPINSIAPTRKERASKDLAPENRVLSPVRVPVAVFSQHTARTGRKKHPKNSEEEKEWSKRKANSNRGLGGTRIWKTTPAARIVTALDEH